jgi:2-oxoglutarate dehydrogenase E2 component (dihydrolipoamide succinyltransferase)
LKQKGDRVRAGEAVAVLETDKVDLEVAAEKGGILTHIERSEGEDVRVGDVLGIIEEAGGGEPEEAPPSSKVKETVDEKQPAHKGEPSPVKPAEMSAPSELATPVAKRLAQEHNIDVAQIPASGSGGRVTKQDVERYLAKREDGQEAVREEHEPVPAAPGKPQAAEREERVRMSRRRRTIAQRLVEAQRTAAILTTFNEIDMSAVMELRERRKQAFETQHGVSLGIASFFVKAAIGALKEFPRLNAEIQGDEMILKHYYDIGVAIGAAEGLVVPVLHDSDRLSFAEIERAIKDYAQKAQDGTPSPMTSEAHLRSPMGACSARC